MIRTWSQGDPDHTMPDAILVDLRAIIPRHPWWRARATLTRAFLEQLDIRPAATVLDVGCGWGVTLEMLEQAGYRVTGLDIARRALEWLDRPGRALIEADLTRPLPSDAEAHDAVLALDVIEHLDDDRAAVAQLARLCHPGGAVVVSVPALPELFSEFDAIQGHRRRYTPETLRAAFDGSGLDLLSIHGWGSWMLPLLRFQRRKSHPPASGTGTPAEIYRRYLNLPPWPAPLLFRLAYAWDQPRALRGRSRAGTSLFALARRPLPESSILPT